MSQKIENDTEAFLRSYVTKRNRNAEAAEDAVHTSHSYTAQEALDKHLIDLIAGNEWQLLAQLDGREITRWDGSKLTLHLAGARIETMKPTLRDELLGWLVNPNIALLFLVGGALLIYLEFNAPGTIVPGALGTLMVLLAIFGLNLLPINYTAVLLLVAALVLLLLEAKFGGHGALAIAGIVCLTFGTLTLVARAGAGDGDQPLGGYRGQRRLRQHHRLSGPPGGARPPHEIPPWPFGPGGQPRPGHGAAEPRRPCAGRGRNLARCCR